MIVLGGGAARAGGLHALARQGDRPRRDGQPRARRAGRRGPDRPDAALPALAALGVRVGPGRRIVGTGPTRCPLAGRTALVTGASRGIGAAIAEVLEREGASRRSGSTCQDAGHRARHHRRRRAGGARRALRGRARHPRPQRGRDQGPHAGQDARGPLAVADGGQPARARADHRGAAAAAARRRADRLRVLDERDRRQRGPDELRDVQGRAARTSCSDRWSSSAGSRSTRSRPGSSRRDDRGDADRRARGRAADELAAPGRAAGRRRRDGRLAARGVAAWTATSSGSAARALLGA